MLITKNKLAEGISFGWADWDLTRLTKKHYF